MSRRTRKIATRLLGTALRPCPDFRINLSGGDYPVHACARDLAQASALFAAMRDGQGLGASELAGPGPGGAPGDVFDASGRLVAHVSYNGKVWAPGPWEPGRTPLYNPYE